MESTKGPFSSQDIEDLMDLFLLSLLENNSPLLSEKGRQRAEVYKETLLLREAKRKRGRQ